MTPGLGVPLAACSVPAMGTRCDVRVDEVGGDAPSSAARAHALAAAEEACERFDALHRLWSPFEPTSMIAAIHRAPAGTPVRVDEETFALLTLCEELRRASEGAFDISIGRLLRAAGLREGAPSNTLPADQPGAQPSVTSLLHLDNSKRTLTLMPGQELDVGAIAKGWATDAALGVLREAGVTRGLVCAGQSSWAGLGAWRVQVSPARGSPVAMVADGAALGVSALSGRESATGTHGHIVDPVSGAALKLSQHPYPSAACVAPSAAIADAWSTVLLLRGRLPGASPGDSAPRPLPGWVATRDGDRLAWREVAP